MIEDRRKVEYCREFSTYEYDLSALLVGTGRDLKL